MPADQTVDFVVMFLVVGLVVLGLLSVILGKIIAWVGSVNTSDVIMSPPATTLTTDETDGRTDGRSASAIDLWIERLEVDRTKQALIELLVYSGWTVDEVRAVLKGANADLGDEVKAARKRLGIEPPERTIRVRDAQGERVIPLEGR